MQIGEDGTMSLEVRISRYKPIKCIYCGEISNYKHITHYCDCDSEWIPFFEFVGYFKTDKDNNIVKLNMYGDDMYLSKEQTVNLIRFLKKWYKFDSDISFNIMHMVEDAMFDDDIIAISAIW